MVSVGGNLYSVPDATRKRVVEVHTLADEIHIFEDGTLIATHPVLEGRGQRRVAPGHRKMPRVADRTPMTRRSLIAAAPATSSPPARSPSTTPSAAASPARESGHDREPEIVPSILDRIRRTLVGLRMPRALEVLDQTVRQLERGEVSRAGGDRHPARRGADRAREPARQDGADDGPALDHQDAGRLRLLLPAVARPQPHPDPRPARLHRPQRGGPLPRPARHRQEPPGDRARRRGGEGRPQRLLLPPSPTSSRLSPRPSARAVCASGSASSAGPRS